MPNEPEKPRSSKPVSSKKSLNKESKSKPNRADAEAAASALRCYNSQDYRLEDPEFSTAAERDSEPGEIRYSRSDRPSASGSKS